MKFKVDTTEMNWRKITMERNLSDWTAFVGDIPLTTGTLEDVLEVVEEVANKVATLEDADLKQFIEDYTEVR